jgi:hypothetical protein
VTALRSSALVAAVLAAACGAASPRFPADVHAALADEPMRRLETESLVVYYPAKRQAEARRLADRAEGCAAELRAKARIKNRYWAEKVTLVVPELPFNNAFVMPAALGTEEIALVPSVNTLDFATELGLPPDPAHIACHELVHYVQFQQIAGLWGALDRVFGHLISPQVGLDSWFFEGLATHYEAALQPGAGRPRWPVFRGTFHAGYAGEDIGGGDLSELGRRAPPGHNYLVGTFFLDFLFERYGEEKVWQLVAEQGRSAFLLVNVNGRFKAAFGRSLSELIDEFAAWTRQRFPVRPTPASQRRVRTLGMSARYARGRGGHEAAIWNDVDAPTRLTVWGPDGRERASIRLVDLVPPRQLVTAAPILSSGLSITDDGRVFFTTIDPGATYQKTRLFRWDGELTEIATGLGSGGAVDGAGTRYLAMAPDGDRWELVSYTLASGERRVLTRTEPGQYVMGAQVSPDGTRLVASVWDRGFVLWIIDATSGGRLYEIRTDDQSPVFDGSFADDATIVYLATVDGRFQVMARDLASGATRVLTDAPYAVLAPRVVGDRVRFLNRQGWRWTIDEVAMARPQPPAPVVPAEAPADATAVAAPVATPPSAAPASRPAVVQSDEPYSQLDGLVRPQLHTFALIAPTAADEPTNLVGAALAGGDRLGFHRWALGGFLQPESGRVSGYASYINANLAPWLISGDLVYLDWHEERDGVSVVDHRIQRIGSLGISRVWRETIGTTLFVMDREDRDSVVIEQDDGDDIERDAVRRRMTGAGVTLDVAALDGSRITSHGWWTSVMAVYYPGDLTSLIPDVTSLRGELGVRAPVPWTRRHTLSLAARGRRFLSGEDLNLLRLGGSSPLAVAWDRSTDREGPDPGDDPRLPESLILEEPLRGYEDFTILTDWAAIGDVSWSYPLVIDRGVATTLWFLPASFVRQIDLELFASAAVDDRGRDGFHAAAGGAVTLSMSLLRFPLSVGYQASRRLVDDDAILQLILIGAVL